MKALYGMFFTVVFIYQPSVEVLHFIFKFCFHEKTRILDLLNVHMEAYALPRIHYWIPKDKIHKSLLRQGKFFNYQYIKSKRLLKSELDDEV